MKRICKDIDIDGEIVHLAKSDNIWGWRVVHPIKNADGKINYMNLLFGGKGNLIVLLVILVIAATAIYGVSQMTESCRELAANPCKYSNMDCSKIYNPIYDYDMPIIENNR